MHHKALSRAAPYAARRTSASRTRGDAENRNKTRSTSQKNKIHRTPSQSPELYERRDRPRRAHVIDKPNRECPVREPDNMTDVKMGGDEDRSDTDTNAVVSDEDNSIGT